MFYRQICCDICKQKESLNKTELLRFNEVETFYEKLECKEENVTVPRKPEAVFEMKYFARNKATTHWD